MMLYYCCGDSLGGLPIATPPNGLHKQQLLWQTNSSVLLSICEEGVLVWLQTEAGLKKTKHRSQKPDKCLGIPNVCYYNKSS